MGKFSNHIKLKKEEIEELLVSFAEAVSSVKDPVEAANLVRDLLSEQEAIMLARRIQIARYLYNGFKYEDIQRELKVSPPTIARVQTWLREYGDGFRAVLERTKSNNRQKSSSPSALNLKRRYPMYFWPQLLLEEIVNSATAREKQKLLSVIKQMKQKTKLSKQLNLLLNPVINQRKEKTIKLLK